ncbi:MAG: histidine--tRNA ligase, partial [Alphaproteobacteria bacterium]|nr:histidine--tRNA ligase [Alphaproteobacteria bacterium]
AALAHLGRETASKELGPVVVLVMDRDQLPRYQKMVQSLRQAGLSAEMYLGGSGMKAQMKYADKRHAPCVVIQGGDEREKGEVQIKDLIEGAIAAQNIKDNKDWKAQRPAQFAVSEDKLVAAVSEIVARHTS